MDSFEILVVILSVAFAFLLVLAIIGLYHILKLTASLRRISDKAERVASNVEAASNFVKHSAGPVAISKFVSNIVEAVKTNVKSKEKKDE